MRKKNPLIDINRDNLCGFDIDITMVKIASMNMTMNGIDIPNIKYKNSFIA